MSLRSFRHFSKIPQKHPRYFPVSKFLVSFLSIIASITRFLSAQYRAQEVDEIDGKYSPGNSILFTGNLPYAASIGEKDNPPLWWLAA